VDRSANWGLVVQPPDEFAWIDRLRPLTRGDPRALNLMDDAAILPSRPGFDLVISTDAMVEGVHFRAVEAMDIVARRLLRTSLSDLAAKAAEPFGYFLNIAWPSRFDHGARDRFIEGLDQDGRLFGIVLLGGDTVSTPGPLTIDAVVLGWVPQGRAVRRAGARAGDRCVVCGRIGDGWLGLKAARGEIDDPDGYLANRYRLPEPLFGLTAALRDHANAAADVSDGLVADAQHVAEASGLGLGLDLAGLPLSPSAEAWLARQPDRATAYVSLATGGDDYAVVCAVSDSNLRAFEAKVAIAGLNCGIVGAFHVEPDFVVTFAGLPLTIDQPGWRHL
jgi:thiamine-monophosphate kinase